MQMLRYPRQRPLVLLQSLPGRPQQLTACRQLGQLAQAESRCPAALQLRSWQGLVWWCLVSCPARPAGSSQLLLLLCRAALRKGVLLLCLAGLCCSPAA